MYCADKPVPTYVVEELSFVLPVRALSSQQLLEIPARIESLSLHNIAYSRNTLVEEEKVHYL